MITGGGGSGLLSGGMLIRGRPNRVVVERTPVDVLEFASSAPGLGCKLGLDATRRLPGETNREWPAPIVPSAEVEWRVEALYPRIVPGRGDP